jgi:hypothetical protein
MTAYAKIAIIGKSRSELLEEIARIRAWGPDIPVLVSAGTQKEILESLEKIEEVINGDLGTYIIENFGSRRTTVKTGGNDDLYLVPDPDFYTEKGHFRKVRHTPTNITPKKKKRKKQRR